MFKRIFIFISILSVISNVLLSQVHVKGYYRKDGTYVQPHERTHPDGNPYNNYSFPGNYNPNTGKITKGNPDTYLENYYDKNSKSGYSTKSTYIPEDQNNNILINTTSYPYFNYQTFNNNLSTINTKINQGLNDQITIAEIDDLIKGLLALKTILNNENKDNIPVQSNKKNLYYIVIYSEMERTLAQDKLNICTNNKYLNNYKYSLFPAIVDGCQWFRVALGEFTSYNDAKSKLNNLSNLLPNDSWIIKY